MNSPPAHSPPPPPKVGISACLLGDEVRWDGRHKRDAFVCDRLRDFVTLVPVCPEVEAGLPVPREPMNLHQVGGAVRVLGESGADRTELLRAFAEKRVRELRALDLSGYVLKARSPSCGLGTVPVYASAPPITRGAPVVASPSGRGAFAEVLARTFPQLPLEEEDGLQDPSRRERFVVRLFAYGRARALLAGRVTAGALVRFHTVEKLLVLAHDEPIYRKLGPLVAGVKKHGARETAERYVEGYLTALERPATVKRHVNVLQHLAGHLRGVVGDAERTAVADAIEAYRAGRGPRATAVSLIREHARRHAIATIAGQTYLEPFPEGLAAT